MANWQARHKVVPAVYIVFRRDDKVLLLKRANTGYRDGEYSMPSGHFDGGESALTAAVREAKEETDIELNPQNLTLVHTQHRLADEGDHERLNLFFAVTKWSGEPKNVEPDKCSELRWFALDDLPSNMVPELQHFFRHLADGRPYGDFGF